MELDKSKKIKLKFGDKPFGSVNSFVIDQDGNLIASLLRDDDLWSYTIVFHFDKSVEPFRISCSLYEAMSIVKKLMRERGFEVNRL